MLYRVTIFRPNPYERSYDAAESWIVGTRRAAELTARAKLPDAYETDYSAQVARLPYAEVTPWKKGLRFGLTWKQFGAWSPPKVTIETNVHYVPSVGELGYAP